MVHFTPHLRAGGREGPCSMAPGNHQEINRKSPGFNPVEEARIPATPRLKINSNEATTRIPLGSSGKVCLKVCLESARKIYESMEKHFILWIGVDPCEGGRGEEDH